MSTPSPPRAPVAVLQPASLYLRGVAWSLDAALLAPLALAMSWRWAGPAAEQWLAHVQALLELGARATGAALIDGATLPRLAASLMTDPRLAAAVAAVHAATWAALWPPLLAYALGGAIYHVASERLPGHGSIGKRLLGLRVGDRHGQPLRPARGMLRHAAAALSWLTLNLGHLMAALAPRHLALHDRCSGTRVLACGSGTRAAPRWAAIWLALVGVAAAAATAWAMLTALATIRTALEAALH